MRNFKTLKTFLNSVGETSLRKRDALLVLADLEELVALCREDVFTEMPECAEDVTRIKNIVGAL